MLELLLGFELDEDAFEELETMEELLGDALELLFGFELDEDTATELELFLTDEELESRFAI